MRNLNLTLVPLGIALLVAGCGGGGGSTGDNTNIPTATVQITSSNAQTVASGSVSSTKSMSATGGAASSTIVGAMVTSNNQMPSVLKISLAEFERARNLHLPAAAVVGAIPSTTRDCTTNQISTSTTNTFTVSYQDANDNSTFDAGDSMSFVYRSCVTSGVTMNGSMTFAVNTLGGTATAGDPETASFTVTFSNYSYVASGSLSMNGDITIAASNNGTTLSASMHGSSFEMTSSVEGSFRMTTYSFNYSENVSTGGYSFGAGVGTPMTMGGSAMGGYVTISTSPEFSGIGSGNPSIGTMVITGDHSSLTIQTVDTINVDLLVDSNGDGTTDDTIHTTWANL